MVWVDFLGYTPTLPAFWWSHWLNASILHKKWKKIFQSISNLQTYLGPNVFSDPWNDLSPVPRIPSLRIWLGDRMHLSNSSRWTFFFCVYLLYGYLLILPEVSSFSMLCNHAGLSHNLAVPVPTSNPLRHLTHTSHTQQASYGHSQRMGINPPTCLIRVFIIQSIVNQPFYDVLRWIPLVTPIPQ